MYDLNSFNPQMSQNPSTSPSDNVDLAQFKTAFREAKGTDEVPDGTYQAVVEKVYLTHAKRSGNPMLAWRLRIISEPYRGLVLFRQNMLVANENIKWLKKDLYVCGLRFDEIEELPDHLEKLIGLKLDVEKVTNNKMSSVYLNRRIEVADPVPGEAGGAADSTPF
jgi:hypothetical protein